MTDTPKLNLRQKLVQVYAEVDHVEKAGDNKKQGYKFVRAADVLRAIRTSFATLGIYAETNYELLGTYDIKTNSGGTMHTATVKATIRLLDADSEETLTISGLGDGADSGDKGIFKAQTGATKNALRNGTLLPDEADPEADESVDTSVAGSSSRQDDVPDFQEARYAAPQPTAAPKAQKLTETTKEAPKATTEAPSASQTIKPAPSPSREPGDDTESVEVPAAPHPEAPEALGSGVLPTEAELTDYRKQFSKLGDDLSAEGKLKSSKGLPINRKLLVFLLSITGAPEAKVISKAQWDDFFKRVDTVKGLADGLVGLAKLVNKANGIEDPKKK